MSEILDLQGLEADQHDSRVPPISSLYSFICCL
jgi:hypothetical protein